MHFNVRVAVSALMLCAGTGQVAAQVASAPAMPAPPAAMRPGDGYVLGVNDEVEVTVFTSPQNQVVRTRIKEDGTISLPFIGTITARDRTARQLSADIATALRTGGFFTKPVVSVDVTQYVSNSITVFGEVNASGVYPLDRPMSIGMMIARAGGVRNGGADYAIVRRANDPVEHRVQLAALSGEWSGSTSLLAGDVVYVPVAPTIYVYGQVNSPGSFPILTGMTIRQALARAGGPTLAGSERKISIYRAGKTIKQNRSRECGAAWRHAVRPRTAVLISDLVTLAVFRGF